MSAGILGCITTPKDGHLIPEGVLIGADNGKYGKGYPGDNEWFAWLERTVGRYGADRFLFAVAPDAPLDAAATLVLSTPWLAPIRELGVPAAFAAQDGCEALGLPWDEFDVLFIGGSTGWKIGPAAERLAREARARGKTVHMGRVNSLRRLRIAEWFGCATADGTYLAFGPVVNLARLKNWLEQIHAEPSLAAHVSAHSDQISNPDRAGSLPPIMRSREQI